VAVSALVGSNRTRALLSALEEHVFVMKKGRHR
jgi:hypothetical protein